MINTPLADMQNAAHGYLPEVSEDLDSETMFSKSKAIFASPISKCRSPNDEMC